MSVSLKVGQEKKSWVVLEVFFLQNKRFVIPEHPNGHDNPRTASVSGLISSQRRCPTRNFSASFANGFCEQLEVDFPSVSDHSISISGQGALTVELSSQETRFSLSSDLNVAIYSRTVSEASLSLFKIEH